MIRVLFSILLIAHGLIHTAIWLSPTSKEGTFDPKHSWILDSMGLQTDVIHGIAVVLAIVAALALVSGAIGLLAHQGWAHIPVLAGSVVSLLLIVVYFNPWMSLAILLDLGIVYLLVVRHWPAR
jgi:hypothetical protein